MCRKASAFGSTGPVSPRLTPWRNREGNTSSVLWLHGWVWRIRTTCLYLVESPSLLHRCESYEMRCSLLSSTAAAGHVCQAGESPGSDEEEPMSKEQWGCPGMEEDQAPLLQHLLEEQTKAHCQCLPWAASPNREFTSDLTAVRGNSWAPGELVTALLALPTPTAPVASTASVPRVPPSAGTTTPSVQRCQFTATLSSQSDTDHTKISKPELRKCICR